MRPANLPIEKLDSLPLLHRAVIPEDYRDLMGHMNVRWYMALFDEAGYPLFDLFGMTVEYYQSGQAGAFDLEHHIRYLNEVRVGDTVAIRGRLLARTAKRLHYMMLMVNETRGLLAATVEIINSHADLAARRTSPYPDHIAAKIDALIADHARLDWEVPVCGVMQP